MTDTQPTGADLARIALLAARANAKTAPTTARRTPRRAMRRSDGRDPLTLGTAITHLITERAWEAPTAGGSIIDRWPTIAPELQGKVTAERFDPETGCLHLRPATNAYATQLRLLGAQMVARINTKAGTTAVRSIRVLPPGAASPNPEAAPDTAPAAFTAVKPAPRTRGQAPPGYHRALEAARATRPAAASDQELRDRHFADSRGSLREPQTAFADGTAALETAQRTAGRDAAEQIRQAAIQRARDERAGRIPAVPTAFQRTA